MGGCAVQAMRRVQVVCWLRRLRLVAWTRTMGFEAEMALVLPWWATWLVVFDCWYGRAVWQPAEVAAQASVKCWRKYRKSDVIEYKTWPNVVGRCQTLIVDTALVCAVV